MGVKNSGVGIKSSGVGIKSSGVGGAPKGMSHDSHHWQEEMMMGMMMGGQCSHFHISLQLCSSPLAFLFT